MKKILSVVLCICLVLGCCAMLTGCGSSDKTTLYVYNWGQYISEGDDDSLDVIAAFEEAYPNIKVQYSTYDSNEIMYSKLANGGITVDVIIPSDYMIGRMRQEGMLMELNFDNIPNYQYIDETFHNTAYDPENKYSVPYTWGTVGIIYNTKYVDEADVTGWELLWNEKYAGKILMFDNSRDAFGIAQYMLGYDVNTTDEATLKACADKLAEQKPVVQQYVMDQIFDAMENEEAWIAPYYDVNTTDEATLKACADKLAEQKPVVQQYVMDQIFDAMENEEAWIAPYYAGDYLTMAENNPDLAFYQPKEQGFNVFIDAMCIPTCCQEKEAAELFINFLCDPEISGAARKRKLLSCSSTSCATRRSAAPTWATWVTASPLPSPSSTWIPRWPTAKWPTPAPTPWSTPPALTSCRKRLPGTWKACSWKCATDNVKMTVSDETVIFYLQTATARTPFALSLESTGPTTWKPPGPGVAPGVPRKSLERREVEKRIYGVERERLTASATFLLLRYFLVLNCLYGVAPGVPRKSLERREVEKRIYGVERERLTASATFLLLRYFLVLNCL